MITGESVHRNHPDKSYMKRINWILSIRHWDGSRSCKCTWYQKGNGSRPYRVVELFQTRDCEEVMDVDTILKKQLDKVHPVQHQSVHHGLFQRVHLSNTKIHVIIIIIVILVVIIIIDSCRSYFLSWSGPRGSYPDQQLQFAGICLFRWLWFVFSPFPLLPAGFTFSSAS